jgi:hypothetical protein
MEKRIASGLPDGPVDAEFPSAIRVLYLLSRLRSGVTTAHPEIARDLAFVVSRGRPVRSTYEASLALMLLQSPLRTTTEMTGQREKRLRDAYPAWQSEALTFILRQQVVSSTEVGGWDYRETKRDGAWQTADIINTMFALLGLEAAVKAGADVPLHVWTRAADRVILWQQSTGEVASTPIVLGTGVWQRVGDEQTCRRRSFRYRAGDSLLTSCRTAAGLLSLSACARYVSKAESMEKVDAALRDGVGWLDAHWGPPTDRREPWTENGMSEYLYYLMVAELNARGLDVVGERPLRGEAGRAIVAKQRGDGSWGGRPIMTAMAMYALAMDV